VQKVLGVAADGIIGNITLAAINSRSPLPLFGAIQEARKAYIDKICVSRPANRKFMKGWILRVSSMIFND
jgi:lysozyme family protein